MPISNLKLPAPAKINQFLHICGKREDGYHNLQTIFQFLEFSDQLNFTLRDDTKIKLLTPSKDIKPEDNLIYKAALALQQSSQCQLGVDITFEKNITNNIINWNCDLHILLWSAKKL